MHLKVFVKLKKTLKTLSSGPKKPKNTPKNQKKKKKNPKKPKTHWAGFFKKKKRVFSSPVLKPPLLICNGTTRSAKELDIIRERYSL
jgi:hypothetical protein